MAEELSDFDSINESLSGDSGGNDEEGGGGGFGLNLTHSTPSSAESGDLGGLTVSTPIITGAKTFNFSSKNDPTDSVTTGISLTAGIIPSIAMGLVLIFVGWIFWRGN